VREAIVEKLRRMGSEGGVIMDGRDIGTKVFPMAEVKLFLEAAPEVRALRRWIEERERGREVSIDQIAVEIEERDRRDRGRAATPLVRSVDAVLIDTSDMKIDLVVERVLEIVESQS
jgi:cytidylate kinase